jgi:hypothetical protein
MNFRKIFYICILYKMSSFTIDLANQTALEPQKLIAFNNTGDKGIRVNTDGLKLEYDINTAIKSFQITSAGVNWTDGVSNHTTGLERLALVQTAFQAVELPPNATTLKINDTILLTDGTNTTTINDTSISLTNSTAEVVGSLSGNALSLLTDATISSVGTAGINATTGNLTGTLLSSLGGGVVGMPSPPYPAPDANWSLSVQSGTYNPSLYLSKSAPFTNSTSMTLDLNNLTHFQATGSPSPNDDFTISTNKNLIMTADNTTLTADGRMTILNTTIGGLSNPQLVLRNTNTSATINQGFPNVEIYKSGRNAQTNETIGSFSFYGLDAGSQKTEFARIQAKTENVASGNEDGTISIFASVNGANSEVFNFNGGQNENNSFRPLDLNSNALITSSGDLTLNATGSSGTGAVNISAKSGAVINLNSNVVMDNNESFEMVSQSINTYTNTINAYTTIIKETDNLQDIKKLTLETNLVRMNDYNGGTTEQADIYPTFIQFTSSGNATDSLSMYNDSADGGAINWYNISGTNGLTITSSHSLTLKSTAPTYPIQLDSDVINLQNTNTTTSTANHNADIKATSNGLESTTFLKLQLNGADIWIPYFTSDPSA